MGGWTKERLIAFEERVKQAFLDKQIHAPVHLSGGNEDALLDIFREVRPQDWVFSGWRSHYHALLKGIPEEELFQMILEGRSMYVMSREYRVFCSSIVGGILPIACGLAMGIRTRGRMRGQSHEDDSQVWVFVGDMTARTGLFQEFMDYASGHQLPVKVVIEDNGVSTNTPTLEVWGQWINHQALHPWLIRSWYNYKRKYPHVGVGQHVEF